MAKTEPVHTPARRDIPVFDGTPDPADFGTFGRYRETPVEEMSPETRSAYEYTRQLRGLVPGPHKIWLANPKLSKAIVATGAYFQEDSSLSKSEIEIVTNIVTGHWLAAYAVYEHEKIGVQLGGLQPEQAEALIAGLPTSFDAPRQQIVYELASTLVQPRVVPGSLYRRAQETIGVEGIVDVTVLMGWFTSVSLTLAAFDVPSNAVGLKQ
ncbi:carboxymuconolactone decarboxylase family protein [Streptomyces sp. NPDC050534]|uniref:carboxymuconolactone decarboxylase family protein n=1 Tax=Streptomyces sp. NPDC050534 TaxID=3365625 RepID=UPI003795C16C